MSSKLFLVLVFLTLFTRFLKLDWGNGYYFHPDENNMATAVSHISPVNLDPKFYAYGQFPLYLAYYSFRLYSLAYRHLLPDHLNFSQSIIALRFWSAIFSALSIYIFYIISKKLIHKKYFPEIFGILLIFCPGLIQFSHFGTTESILIFVLAANILLGLKIYESKGLKIINFIFLSSLVNSIGLASKITSIILTGPILLGFLVLFIKREKKLLTILLTQLFIIVTIVLYALFSPYNILSKKDYFSTMNYETAVATGKTKVFYTNQFINTQPYIYQFVHIFPYVSGVPIFLTAIIGVFYFIRKSRKSKTSKMKWLIFLLTPLIYFIYTGQLYTKWTRFMSPIFFMFPFFAAYLICLIKSVKLKILLLIICIIPGLTFFSRYFSKDIRITASEWVDNNIPENSTIISEGGNVVNFPISEKYYKITQFNFYDLDQDPELLSKLTSLVSTADYIFVPSRRIFKNQQGIKFPQSDKYYRQLFSGISGFKLIKTFPDNFGILNPENAEETWTVFDRPVIRIFQKVK